MNYTKSQFFKNKQHIESTPTTPRVQLTNLKYPTSNGINYGLVEHSKIESPTIYNKVSQFNTALETSAIK